LQSDTTAVRAGEELPVAALSEYLRGKVDGAESGITLQQFPEGHSNLTYLVLCGAGREYVLRRGPLGPVAPKAHDMAREFRVLQAVSRHFPEDPKPILLCEDTSVIGAVFFLMERRRGVILRDELPPEFSQVPNHGRRISKALVDCLVRLHAIDVTDPDLAALGKPDGFLERQVHGWAERWTRARTEDVPQMEHVGTWLAQSIPTSPPPTLVHNDFKLDNVMFRSVDEVEAVLDWEMATIGDPLADLGLTLCYWWWINAPGVSLSALPSLTSRPGWYTRLEFVSRYAEQTGRDVSRLLYYEVLGIYKLAVILQQIYFRFRRGQTTDQRFRDFEKRVAALAGLAARLVEKHA
jgi:aminoglycoside phosphotransferase (APT) family kinase protein